MNRETLISEITEAVLRELGLAQMPPASDVPTAPVRIAPQAAEAALQQASVPVSAEKTDRRAGLADPLDADALDRMLTTTTARIGVGRTGARLRTQTLLKLRADHAAARDAVFRDVSPVLLERLGLFSVQTLCQSRGEHLTRPDLGRQLPPDVQQLLKTKCKAAPDVQLFVSDGLSSLAIESNLSKLLPVLTDGLTGKSMTLGTTFFVKYGRVAVMEQVALALDCRKVVCVLIGERPGLGSAESMSAYLAYAPKPGMPESERTVVSNIYSRGIAAAEAGAYLAELIELMLEQKASGVHLKK